MIDFPPTRLCLTSYHLKHKILDAFRIIMLVLYFWDRPCAVRHPFVYGYCILHTYVYTLERDRSRRCTSSHVSVSRTAAEFMLLRCC